MTNPTDMSKKPDSLDTSAGHIEGNDISRCEVLTEAELDEREARADQPLSEEELVQLEKAEREATEGPWIPKHWNTVDGWGEFDYWDSPTGPIMRVIDNQYHVNRRFIALARNKMRRLLATVRELQANLSAVDQTCARLQDERDSACRERDQLRADLE